MNVGELMEELAKYDPRLPVRTVRQMDLDDGDVENVTHELSAIRKGMMDIGGKIVVFMDWDEMA